MIQRHSSWEHQLLGDMPPDELAKIGTWQDLIEQTEWWGPMGFASLSRRKRRFT